MQICFWDGSAVGDSAQSIGKILIRGPRAVRRLFFDNVVGFGEGYMENEIAVEGDLVDILTAINHGYACAKSYRGARKRLTWPGLKHSIAASKSNVHHHYDIGNDFYRLWLDRQCVYTCAYYPNPDATLDQAQISRAHWTNGRRNTFSLERTRQVCGR